MLLNASELYEGLKKSKGKKRKQMNPDNRAEIVKAFTEFKENDYCKVFDKWHFYYNRQSIMLTNVDENGKHLEMPEKKNKEGEEAKAKSIKLTPLKITVESTTDPIEISEFEITDFDKAKFTNLQNRFDSEIKPMIAALDYKEQKLKVRAKKANYWYDADKDTIIEEVAGKQTELGCGKIVIKSSYKKPTKTKGASIAITVELTKDLQKDYEIIPYSPDETENLQWIADFMAKYITKPFEYVDNVVGVEVNFNKVFYQPEKIREVSKINKDLEDLEDDLSNLEKELTL